MTIQSATADTIDGHPILNLIIDGHPAYVFEPKETLLEAGVVVLLDDDGYWADTIHATFEGELVAGGTSDPAILAITRRFVEGETGNLLS